jgi:UDP-N-acetylmuramate dehydrogenase
MLSEEVKKQLLEFCAEDSSQVLFDEALSNHSTISIGGKASAWLVPASIETLSKAKRLLEKTGIKTLVIGNASNVLFPDEGLSGVVFNLNSPFFTRREFQGNKVIAGAGVGLGGLISECCKRGFSGLEGLAGIPGTVGGAIVTNASYNTTISDPLESVKVFSKGGDIKEIKKEELKFEYRSSSLSKEEIIIEAVFSLEEVSPSILKEKLQENIAEKMESQPLDKKTLGCVFKNPPDDARKSWELIDMAGLRGYKVGDAVVSEKHANFIVNNGTASSQDVITLMNDIKKKVFAQFAVELEAEIEVLQ